MVLNKQRKSSTQKTISVQVDKFNNVIKNGLTIGKIELDGAVFIGINLVTQRQAKSFDYDEIVAWFK